MPKLLVFANLELAFELPEGTKDPEEFARRKERKLLRALRKLIREDAETTGSLESLEFESFAYADALQAESVGYYYNKHDRRAETN